MKRVNWRCPYALMVAECHCNRKWTSTIAITVSEDRAGRKSRPAVNRWDCHHVIDIICWLCKWLNIPKLGSRNGLCELDENYKWKSCTGTVPLYIQYPGGDSEVSGSPCLRNQEETTGSVDRKGQYDDADWFKDNPIRAGGTVFARTDATVAQYCSYIKGILTTD